MSIDEENIDTKRQVYIFFDFECTQDDLVECTDGYQPQKDNSSCINCGKENCGVYEHKPNLCIVHDDQLRRNLYMFYNTSHHIYVLSCAFSCL
jgi:hypothetical protein